VRKDYGPAGIRFELADIGVMPLWNENNHLLLRNGQAKAPFIHPVFIDREIPRLRAQLDELNKLGGQLSDVQKRGRSQASLNHSSTSGN
jgi:hypothetical protein